MIAFLLRRQSSVTGDCGETEKSYLAATSLTTTFVFYCANLVARWLTYYRYFRKSCANSTVCFAAVGAYTVVAGDRHPAALAPRADRMA
jgi:hypothetical protein